MKNPKKDFGFLHFLQVFVLPLVVVELFVIGVFQLSTDKVNPVYYFCALLTWVFIFFHLELLIVRSEKFEKRFVKKGYITWLLYRQKLGILAMRDDNAAILLVKLATTSKKHKEMLFNYTGLAYHKVAAKLLIDEYPELCNEYIKKNCDPGRIIELIIDAAIENRDEEKILKYKEYLTKEHALKLADYPEFDHIFKWYCLNKFIYEELEVKLVEKAVNDQEYQCILKKHLSNTHGILCNDAEIALFNTDLVELIADYCEKNKTKLNSESINILKQKHPDILKNLKIKTPSKELANIALTDSEFIGLLGESITKMDDEQEIQFVKAYKKNRTVYGPYLEAYCEKYELNAKASTLLKIEYGYQ